MTDNEISSISDLLRILTELGEPAEGHSRFFRGQGNAEWDILPGIYRNQKLVENEDKIIKEALLNCPDDFSPADTLLEKLVKLQHYGYPTRLLDLTANALVGLYFACSNLEHHDKDGQLIILDIPNENVKYDDSDKVSLLSAIALQNNSFDVKKALDDCFKSMAINGKFHLNRINSTLEGMSDFIDKNLESVKEFTKDLDLDSKKIIEEKKDELMKQIKLEVFNNQTDIVNLLGTIRQDKPSFDSRVLFEDLANVLCVKVKLNNNRISRQQGSFLIVGIHNSKLLPARIPNAWQRKHNGSKIIVKADSKTKILKELKAFGISKQILFPELESQASEIIDQYRN